MNQTRQIRGLIATAAASAVFALTSASLFALPIITQVVETGGDDEPTDTIQAQFTGMTFVTGVANEPVAGTAADAPYTVGRFQEEAPMFVDRNHQWNGATPDLPLPKYLLGGEYIMSGNDNRDNPDYRLDITISEEAFVYLLIDNRLGDGAGGNPPDFTGDRNGDGIGDMEWVLTEGWEPVKTGYNRSGDPDWPDEVGADEGGDGVGPGVGINQWSSVYVKRIPAGTFSIFAPDNNGQNMYGVVVAGVPRAPTVTGASGGLFGVRFEVTDAGGISISTNSIVLTLDGTAVSPQSVTKTADVTRIEYTAPTPLLAASTHTAVLTVSDTATPPNTLTETLNFTVEPYGTITADMKVTADTTRPGFKVRTHQIPVARPAIGSALVRALTQLANGFIDPDTAQPYENEADLSGAANGVFTVEGVVNWDELEGASGSFNANSTPPAPDGPIPGIPGINGSTDNFVVEIVSFLDLPAGVHRFGVNSDDGFVMYAAPSPQDALGVQLGVFNGDRGFADSLFTVVVLEAGIYPIRLIFWEQGGGAGVELFSVDTATNQKILVNDRSNPNAIKAYHEGQVRPFLKSITPLADAVDVDLDSTIEIVIADGSTQVQATSVKLTVNGQAVSAAVTKPAGSSETRVTYKPAGGLPPDSNVALKLEYSDNASPAVNYTREYSFTTKPDIRIIFAIDDTTMWRYDRSGSDLGTAWRQTNFNDSAWPEGAALIADETGNTVEPIRTPIDRFNDAGEYVATFYFRTRFNFTGDPSATRLRLRHVVDDGALFYLNGVEVHRFGYAPGATVAYNNTGATGHENAYEGPFEISNASLVVGENVFAAEVHQSGTSSSDIVFGAELQAIASAPVVDEPKFSSITRSAGNVVISWTGAGALQSAETVTGPWADVSNASSPHTATIIGNARFYRLRR